MELVGLHLYVYVGVVSSLTSIPGIVFNTCEECKNKQPIQSPISTSQKSSVIGCLTYCLDFDFCALIRWSNGNCSLYRYVDPAYDMSVSVSDETITYWNRPDPCLNSPCQNYGSCSPHRTGLKCRCYFVYAGDRCENRLNCTTNPCQNSGTCNQNGLYFTCSCPNGYLGDLCETKVCMTGKKARIWVVLAKEKGRCMYPLTFILHYIGTRVLYIPYRRFKMYRLSSAE